MSPSILTSVKKNLNIAKDYTAFDGDIILNINSALATLNQLGIGPGEGISIEDDSTEWSKLIDDDRLNMAQQYVYLQVRLGFDPPTGTVLTSYENKIRELEWRLTVASEEVSEEGAS